MASQNHLAAINDTLIVLIQRFDAMEARQESSDARFEKLYRNFVDKCDMGSHPPFIKMASPISFEKSNQVVLKLQSFHEEKIHAKERVNQFFSQFRQSYKPKTCPCLRPILKRFKKVRDYGKHDDDGSAIFRSNSKFQESYGFFRKALAVEDEKVFNLFDREAKDSVNIPPFLDSNRKAGTAKELVSLFNKKTEDSVVASPVLDSDCRKSKVQACVLGSTFRNGLAASFGHKFIQFGTAPSSSHESSCKNDVVQDFIFTIPVSDDGFVKIDIPAPQVFDERSHSIDCDFQLDYHILIFDTRGKVETILVQDDASTGVVLILQFRYHKGIRDKGGGLAKDKIWKDHSRIFRYKISTILISSCTKESENATAYNKDGTVCLSEFNSMDFLAICELGFVLNAKKRNILEEADPFIVPAAKTRLALNVFDEIPDSNCRVVVNYDMCYCKGIRDKGGGSKFRYMVTLNIHFSCMNASGDSIECSQDGIFEVVGGEFYSSNIQLSRAGKKKFPNVRENYRVHSFYGQKKLTFERNVHGSFGLPDTSHILEGGILTGRRMLTMSDSGCPFTVNIYPFISLYIDSNFPVDYAFFDGNASPITDGSATYYNMFAANYAILVWTLQKNGFGNLPIIVEIGWPTDGDRNATLAYAQRFNQGFMSHILSGRGTPMRPGPIDAYPFSLIDKNAKSIDPGHFERHWGIFTSDGLAKYQLNLGSTNSEALVPAKGMHYMARKWCVMTPSASFDDPQVALSVSYACGLADCTSLGYGTSCGNLDGRGNISYTVNIYYQRNNQLDEVCKIPNLSMITETNPSVGSCRKEIWASPKASEPGCTFAPVCMGFQEYSHGFAGWRDRVEHLFADMHSRH